ncbi:MAG: ATP-binding protein [Peptostreptococcaceae bacterium]|nr:ATP-binding protein [Peptostreptococcaceae bacterium]
MNQKNLIKMTVPTDSSNISVVRMTASSIANRIGFNIEEIDDVKIAVSEACTNVIKHSKVSTFDLFFGHGNDFMEIEIQDKGIGYDFSSLKDPELSDDRESGGLGIYIIKMLMDEVVIDSELNKGTTIYMRKQIGKEE